MKWYELRNHVSNSGTLDNAPLAYGKPGAPLCYEAGAGIEFQPWSCLCKIRHNLSISTFSV